MLIAHDSKEENTSWVSLLLPQVLYLWQRKPIYWLISFRILDFIKWDSIKSQYEWNWISDMKAGPGHSEVDCSRANYWVVKSFKLIQQI